MAALALIGLTVLSQVAAQADTPADSYNQLTGIGSTDSAITVDWTNGLLNADNQPIANDTTDPSPNSDRSSANPASPLSFMYKDFKTLQVKVSQTANITHQGITVSWTGGQPSSEGTPATNFLQMMECYGDSANGPSPEGCEYGSEYLLPSTAGAFIGDREGFTCGAGSAPSTADPATGPATFGDPSFGCDPSEPGTETPAHCDPTAGANGTCPKGYYSIPFVPADSASTPIYEQTSLPQYFDQFNTNEIQVAYTGGDGTGERQFETLTANQSPGLGCGETESNGKTRNCWLVIVPRGTYEPNGYHVSPTASGLYSYGRTQVGSTLSAGNWAQRIQIHLNYTPLNTNCPPNVVPDGMVGTQAIYRAVASWQQALNQQANCAKVYSYTATTENEATAQLSTPGSAGLGFTTIPIGSESASPPTLPDIVYAPVAVTALDFGFNINISKKGYLTTPVNLTPRLVAKALTQTYLSDLPNWDKQAEPPLTGPDWAAKNPQNIMADPAFISLNGADLKDSTTNSFAPMLTGDLSADNRRVWQWVDSDADTASWLDGATSTTDPVAANPAYVSDNLGKSASRAFPQSDQDDLLTCIQVASAATCGSKATKPALNIGYLDPVATNFDQAAASVVAASNSGLTRTWDVSAKASDGTSGWFESVGTELPGQTFIYTMADMPTLAAYGLISAALCDPAGKNCTQPSTASVTTALNSATADSAGLEEVNPAKVPSGGYPLVDVVYAAVPTNQSATALSDYANFIAYAIGQGQTTGSAPGDLPAGYLPLTASLKAQAQSAVKKLQALASPSASPSASASATKSARATASGTHPATHSPATHSSTPAPATSASTGPGGVGQSAGPGGSSTQPGVTATATSTAPAGGTTAGPTAAAASPSASSSQAVGSTASASPAPGAAAGGPSTSPPTAELISGTTPRVNVGGVRMMLIIILIIGAAGAIGGSTLKFGSLAQVSRLGQLNRFRLRVSRTRR
jgi:hypothetical protein